MIWVDETRLLGEGQGDNGGNSEGAISLAEEARLLGEDILMEGAVGWADDNGENGGNGQDAGFDTGSSQDTQGRGQAEGNSHKEQVSIGTQGKDSHGKTDQNNNDDSQENERRLRPTTRAHRQSYGRMLGRGGLEKKH